MDVLVVVELAEVRILLNHIGDLIDRSDHDRDIETKIIFYRIMDLKREFFAIRLFCIKSHVAAVYVRLDVRKAESGRDLAQPLHAHLVFPADVYAAEKRDISHQAFFMSITNRYRTSDFII